MAFLDYGNAEFFVTSVCEHPFIQARNFFYRETFPNELAENSLQASLASLPVLWFCDNYCLYHQFVFTILHS